MTTDIYTDCDFDALFNSKRLCTFQVKVLWCKW